MIRARSVSYAVRRRRLIDSIDMDLVPGRFVVIVGPNGAGKSTLLRLLTGELRPTSGHILIGDRDICGMPPADLARRRAVVAQHAALTFPFTVLEVVLLGITVPGLGSGAGSGHRIARKTLEQLGLGRLANQSYTTLSGGERQRVHIARALCQLVSGRMEPAETALLVDEPTSSLDIGHQLMVLDALVHQKRLGRSVLAVLHDLNLAAAYADEMLLLAGGRLVASGPPAEVMHDSRLSDAFGCDVRTNCLPASGGPYLLPQACAAPPVSVASTNS